MWNEERTRSPRVIVERRQFETEGLSLTLATEDVSAPTDWCFEQPRHMLVVHLAGQLERMESTFAAGPSSDALPSVGDIWAVPAGCRYAALAQGDRVRFAEIRVPAGREGQSEMLPQVARRDPFLHHATARAATLAARDDDLARMALQALLLTLRFHVADVYLGGGQADAGKRAPSGPRRFSMRQEQLLVDYLAEMAQEPMTVERLATLVGVSVARLIEGFKGSFGMTPWQYVVRVRLAEARRLLERGEESITSIASTTGFSSPSHFSTSFSKSFGVSPATYRRRGRQSTETG